MSIHRIGKNPSVSPPIATPASPTGATSRPFSVDTPAPASTTSTTASRISPAEQVRRGDLSLDAYLDLRVQEATRHLEGHLGPGDLARIQRTLREQLATDPALQALIKGATGVTPPADP
ncbi:MAG: hypothetical protein RMJ98_14540 [Myxococcales bacterium]|nr:hypothetical protein [Polyangiaceae bacterium]MDW8250510.1 hypothetical protein [Myxococcales bacterium]